MVGKGNYKSNAVVSKIKKLIRQNSKNQNIVIYCFDTDRLDNNPEAISNFNEEKEYCNRNHYYLIWFNYNIEYVLLGRNVNSNQKHDESQRYVQNKNICIPVNKLLSREIKVNSGNIYLR